MGFLASVNGVITPAEEARVCVLDNGFAFGDSVYEVLRTYDGRPFEPGRHFRRLRASAARLGIEVGLSDAELLARADALLAQAANRESYLRIVVSRGIGDCSYVFERVLGPTVVMICKPLPAYPASQYQAGLRVAAVDVRRNHPRALDPAIKSSNLLNNILAARQAHSRGADEPLLLNQEGFLAEGASTNVFVGRKGALLTPPLSAGILAGITREVVLELVASLGIPCREEALRLADLVSADEAFLTSTTREVVPVREVDATTIGAGAPGPLTRRVMEAFRAYAPAHCGQAALSAAASRSGRTTG
ncbi:MAG TPA: aminotransferase class IV [Vicinamibacteria bacterium]|nr:aminotransferase class IV [Vicinamibacteria bacterium]